MARARTERVRVERCEVVRVRAWQAVQLVPRAHPASTLSLVNRQPFVTSLEYHLLALAYSREIGRLVTCWDSLRAPEMSSYAADFTAHLAASLSHLAPAFVQPSPSASSSNLAAQSTQSLQDAVDEREQELRAILARLRPASSPSKSSGVTSNSAASSSLSGRRSHSPAHLEPSHLAHLVDSAFPPFQGQASAPLSPQIDSVELVTLAQLAIATYGVVLRELMDEANELERHDEYWAAVESEAWNTALYLVQCASASAPLAICVPGQY